MNQLSRRKSKLAAKPGYSMLEFRQLLAGDVQVIQSGNVVTLVGDASDNVVEITQTESGGFLVSGIETTINGGEQVLTVSGRHRFMTFVMNGGDDQVTVEGVTVGRQLSFFGGAGNDQLELIDVESQHFHLQGEAGDDVFQVNAIVRRSAYLYLGDGNDTVAIESLQTGRNFKVFGGGGDDSLVASTLHVSRKLEIEMAGGNDRALLAGSASVGRRARISMGNGNDFLSLRPSQTGQGANFNKGLRVAMGAGADSADFGTDLTFQNRVRLNGGSGTDGISFAGEPIASRHFEVANASVDASIDAIFADLDSLGIETDVFRGVTTSEEPVTLDVNPSALIFLFNGDGVSIDSELLVNGTESTQAMGATVGIDGFVASEDRLEFQETGAITGTFDATNGVLTLSGTASLLEYQSVLRQVFYDNSNANPVSDARTIQIGLTVGDETVTASRELQIVGNTDSPFVTPSVEQVTVDLGAQPRLIDDAIEIGDPDGTTFNIVTVAFVTGFQQDEDVLSATVPAGSNIFASYNGTSGELTLSGTASIADYQAVLRTVAYRNVASDPTSGDRTVRYSVTDGVTTESANIVLSIPPVTGT